MTSLILVIGNKNHSSWSLRPWLALKAAGLAFEERLIGLRRPETKAEILRYSPSGKLPLLIDGALSVWDSLAICEYVAERAPQAGLWPEAADARAVARAVAAEMHSGFMPLRRDYSMDISRRFPDQGSPEAKADALRVQEIWRDCRARFGQSRGDFLFGGFGIADCMYAPVVTRFRTYGLALDPVSQAYCDAVMAHPAMREWCQAAEQETPLENTN
ncbi:glutathione S-transferase family protein [Ferrovibrio sp. MS7]|jgi:glutathione S-transferase|uniref:glutathione S-transferase family protein n=1 Tax=Ferrovibrio plantarum TaxID=3119164 RepID=UPI0031368FA5